MIGKYTTFGENFNTPENYKIGEGCTIGKNVTLHENVQIGDDCIIKDNVTIKENVYIGQGAEIYDNCIIEANCRIEQENIILENTTLIKTFNHEGFKKNQPISYLGNNMIAIGCKSFSFDEWETLFDKMGNEFEYSPSEIYQVKEIVQNIKNNI